MSTFNGVDLLAAIILAALVYMVVREIQTVRRSREARRLHEINQSFHRITETWEERAYRDTLRMTSGRGL